MRTKTLILWLLLSVTMCSFVYGDDFKSGDLYYHIKDDGTAEVTRDTINDYEGLTNVVVPGTVTHNGKTYNVTSIGIYALAGSETLTSVTISDGIKSIEAAAFVECGNLTSVSLPNSVTTIEGSAFGGAFRLTSLTLPNNLTSIGEAAFMYCLGLTSVDIPSSVTYIGMEAFSECINIMSLTVPTGVTNIEEDAFLLVPNIVYSGTATGAPWGARGMNGYVDGAFVYADATKTSLLACNRKAKGAVSLPNSVTTIGNNAFYGCDSITSITIPNSVTSIGERAFYGCDGLTSVNIPNRVTSVGRDAFRYCKNLTSITIPEGITNIENGVFAECKNLTSVTIPNSVTNIEAAAFYGCTSLTSINLPNNVTRIGGSAFYGCSSLTSITIPEGVTSIEGNAFYGCTGLTSVSIPNSVTSIGDYAFMGCTRATITVPNSVTEMGWYAFGEVLNITYYGTSEYAPFGARYWNAYVEGDLVYADSTKTFLGGCRRDATGTITIPNSVTSIGDYAFSGCTGLTSVTIPEGVTSIGDCAFEGCTGLTSVIIPNSVTSIGDNAFYDVFNIRYYGTAEGAPWGARSMNVYADGLFTYSDGTKTILVACRRDATGAITIPSSVTSIKDSAFYNCREITSITIPRDVAYMGNYVFYGCDSLTSVVWNAKNCSGWVSYETAPFYGNKNITSFVFGGEVETISNALCSGLNKLTSVAIPNSVTTIDMNAFAQTGLTSVTIPKSVTSIESAAFAFCDNLSSIVVEAGNPIYDSRNNCNAIIETATNTLAFGCLGTTIPESVTDIGNHAFYGCMGLTSISIPNGVQSIGNYAFYYCSITSITIPNTVTTIGKEAFERCYQLESITIPNSVTSIGDYALLECNNLTSIVVEAGNPIYDSRNNCNAIIETATNTLLSGCQSTVIPAGVTTIYHYAFYNYDLTSITIPASVTTIGAYAFAYCSWLESVTCQAVEPPTIYDYDYHSFYGVNISDIPLYVPAESINKYATAEVWKDFRVIKAIGSNPDTDLLTLHQDEDNDSATRKVFRNGQVQIICGDKVYDIVGREIK